MRQEPGPGAAALQQNQQPGTTFLFSDAVSVYFWPPGPRAMGGAVVITAVLQVWRRGRAGRQRWGMPAQSALSEAFPEAQSSTLLLPIYLLGLSPMAPPLLQGGLENVVLLVENIAPSNKSYFCWKEEREDEAREASAGPAPGGPQVAAYVGRDQVSSSGGPCRSRALLF